jgi:nitrite reductase/ring-hydroxylating ferredoxin subunit
LLFFILDPCILYNWPNGTTYPIPNTCNQYYKCLYTADKAYIHTRQACQCEYKTRYDSTDGHCTADPTNSCSPITDVTIRKYISIVDRFSTHSWFDSKIIRFYTLFKRIISITTGKMVSSLARTMGRTTNLGIIFSYFTDNWTL